MNNEQYETRSHVTTSVEATSRRCPKCRYCNIIRKTVAVFESASSPSDKIDELHLLQCCDCAWFEFVEERSWSSEQLH